ncbi:MAG: biopolymer transporter ExbD [Verrucomicrobiota bacterium]|jgi:biopolymer transport protein ExbD
MRFTASKRRQPPSVIIVSLIDVLTVVLIFLIVTSTFKQQPAVKLVLPEAKQPKAGSSENAPLIVTISKQGLLYFKTDPVTLDRLQRDLVEAVTANPEAKLAIRADTDAPWGQVVKVMEAATAAHIKVANAFIRPAGAQ